MRPSSRVSKILAQGFDVEFDSKRLNLLMHHHFQRSIPRREDWIIVFPGSPAAESTRVWRERKRAEQGESFPLLCATSDAAVTKLKVVHKI